MSEGLSPDAERFTRLVKAEIDDAMDKLTNGVHALFGLLAFIWRAWWRMEVDFWLMWQHFCRVSHEVSRAE